jgi:hypothetical protein
MRAVTVFKKNLHYRYLCGSIDFLLIYFLLVCLVEGLRHYQREYDRRVAAHLDGLGVNSNLAPGHRLIGTGTRVTAIKLLYKSSAPLPGDIGNTSI